MGFEPEGIAFREARKARKAHDGFAEVRYLSV
jgi:hypothetical protein